MRGFGLPTLLALASGCGGASPSPWPSSTPPARDAGPERRYAGGDCLETQTNTIQFPLASAGCRSQAVIKVANICDEPVRLTGVDVWSPYATFVLAQSPALPSEGRPIEAGEAVELAILFTPLTPANFEGQLTLSGQADEAWTRTFALQGASTPPVLHTQSHVVPSLGPSVDLLIVIDNSQDLEPLRESLIMNFAAVAKFLDIINLDMRVAVVTTGGSDARNRAEDLMPPGASITALSTVAAELDFVATANDPLATAADALRKLQTHSDFGAKAKRLTEVIIVTAATEVSPGSVNERLGELLGLTKPQQPQQFSIHPIAPFLPGGGCALSKDDGRLATAAKLTNGVHEDICAPDWHKVLECSTPCGSGWYVVQIPLDHPPVLSAAAIELRLDGELIPPVDNRGAQIWRYDGKTNAVRFEPLYSPEPGQTVEVTYPLACSAAP